MLIITSFSHYLQTQRQKNHCSLETATQIFVEHHTSHLKNATKLIKETMLNVYLFTTYRYDGKVAPSSSFFGCSHQGSPQRIFLLQLFLSTASSSVTSTSAMSYFTTSINLFLAFPVSSFLAIPSSASFSQYTHHLSSVGDHD